MTQHTTKQSGWFSGGAKAGEDWETSTAVTTEHVNAFACRRCDLAYCACCNHCSMHLVVAAVCPTSVCLCWVASQSFSPVLQLCYAGSTIHGIADELTKQVGKR